tara:strand:+ start:99 stop:863 length:765 start_codon:yes stop_codon:yes gene_type:complete
METILITGGNSSFAKKLYSSLKEKKIKFIFADKTKPKLEKINNNIDFFKIDLENSKNVESVTKKILKKYNKIDYLVTYASFRSNKKDIEDENLKNWNKTFSINLTSNFFLIKSLILNSIKKKHKCRIVNISSISSLLISNESPSYQISKSAINHMTRYFASQSGKKGIFINTILPGLIIKDEHKKKFFSNKNSKYRNIVKKTHLTNNFGTIDDVNKMIKFLLFENNNFINGQSIVIDGGVSIEDQFATAHREFR